MEKQASAGGSPKVQPHRLPSAGSPSSSSSAAAVTGAGAPSRFGSGSGASVSPSYPGGAVPMASGGAGAAMSAAAPLRATPVPSGFEAADDRTQQQLHSEHQRHQKQHPHYAQQPQFHEQQHQHQQYPQQQQHASARGTPLNSRSDSMKAVHATSPQQPRPPATPEEKQRIREKYKQRLQERNVQIYQNALEEVMRKERQEAAQRAIFKITCPTRFGQNVHLVGSHAALGEWAVERAMPMTWGEGNIWSVEMKLPRDASSFEYKYIIKEGPHVIWEPGQNHTLGAEKLQKAAAANEAKQSSAADSAYVIEDSWGMGDAASRGWGQPKMSSDEKQRKYAFTFDELP